eukprot:tig00000073_g1722.t1
MLPDAVVTRVLSLLPVFEALRLRPVCKQWQRAIDGALWEHLQLDASAKEPGRLQLEELGRRIQSGRLQLAARPSVKLRLRVPFESDRMLKAREDGIDHRDVENMYQESGAYKLLGAAGAGAGVGAGIRSLHVIVDVGCFEGEPIPGSVFSGLVLGSLSALRPPPLSDSPGAPSAAAAAVDAAPAPAPALTDLTLDIDDGKKHISNYDYDRDEWRPSPAEILPLLSPFRLLRSLALFPSTLEPCIVTGPAVAAIVQCCPLLRSVLFRPRDGATVAALAPLAFLEEVTLAADMYDANDHQTHCDLDIRGGPAALAAGLAGRSIRSFSTERAALVSGADLRGFGAMPLVESLSHLKIDESKAPIAREDVAALIARGTGARRLRRLGAVVHSFAEEGDDGFGDGFLLGLAEAVAASPDPSSPKLHLEVRGGRSNLVAEKVARILSQTSQALFSLRLELARPFTEVEARALLRCGGLAHLLLDLAVDAFEDILPLQGLRGLAGRSRILVVAVPEALAGLKDVAEGALKGWLPSWTVSTLADPN